MWLLYDNFFYLVFLCFVIGFGGYFEGLLVLMFYVICIVSVVFFILDCYYYLDGNFKIKI